MKRSIRAASVTSEHRTPNFLKRRKSVVHRQRGALLARSRVGQRSSSGGKAHGALRYAARQQQR